MARHHYVPQFLLRNWATHGQFFAYYWKDAAKKVIENQRAAVASACQIPNLNSFFGVAKERRDVVETRFFTPIVDTPAADALGVMLSKGVPALSEEQRHDWARLLVSFGLRTPETLEQLGPERTREAFAIAEASPKGSSENEAKVTKAFAQSMPTLERNLPRQIAMEMSVDLAHMLPINGMQWWVRRWDRNAILIGDRPLLTYPRQPRPCGIPLKNRNCLIVLPLSSSTVFFACVNPRTRTKMRGMLLSRLATVINDETIWRCATTVYARDDALASFVVPRLEGKAKGTWQPS